MDRDREDDDGEDDETEFATIAGVELVLINADTRLADFKQTLRCNEVYYHLAQGIRA